MFDGIEMTIPIFRYDPAKRVSGVYNDKFVGTAPLRIAAVFAASVSEGSRKGVMHFHSQSGTANLAEMMRCTDCPSRLGCRGKYDTSGPRDRTEVPSVRTACSELHLEPANAGLG